MSYLFVVPPVMYPQLTRSNITAQGRLVIKLSDEPPRWLVTFDEGNHKDEEIPEDFLGPILGKLDEDESPKSGDPSKPKSKKKSSRSKPAGGVSRGDSKGSSTGSSADENSGTPDSKKGRKSVSFSQGEGQSNDTDTSSPKDSTKSPRSTRSRSTDREARSRRRQALIGDEEPLNGDPKRPRPNGTVAPPVSKKTKTTMKGNEEVIKVPMLTGTLVFYRGARRRVEFIRKF
jgi:hypothetical protein